MALHIVVWEDESVTDDEGRPERHSASVDAKSSAHAAKLLGVSNPLWAGTVEQTQEDGFDIPESTGKARPSQNAPENPNDPNWTHRAQGDAQNW